MDYYTMKTEADRSPWNVGKNRPVDTT